MQDVHPKFQPSNGKEQIPESHSLFQYGVRLRDHKKQCRISAFCRIDEKGRRVYAQRMRMHNPEGNKKPDLTAAIRIIKNAGLPDPRLSSDNPDDQIQSVIDTLCRLSTHDGLTGLFNAASFHAILSREIDRNIRTGRTCGLMVIDIDHFKQINDTYGHCMGDQVLQALAGHLKLSLRSMDIAARIGGEEFAVILPECTPEDAVSAANRIHSLLSPLKLTLEQCDLQLTASSGLVWTNLDFQVNSETLLSEADSEMYRAKRSGRGRLCHRHPEALHVSHGERAALMDLQLGEEIHGR
jgi:diguanylate cyclase